MSFISSILFRILKLKALQWVISFLIRTWPWGIKTWIVVLVFGWYTLVPLANQYLLGLPPGPLAWPIVGNALQLVGSSPHKKFAAWRLKYGAIVFFKMGNKPCLVINSAEMAKEILGIQSVSFEHRPPAWAFDKYLRINEDTRNLMHLVSSRFFSNSGSIQAVAEIRKEETTSLLKVIEKGAGRGADLRQELQWYTLKLLSRILLSRKLENREEDFAQNVLSISHRSNTKFHIEDMVPFLWLLKSSEGTSSLIAQVLKEVTSFVEERAQKVSAPKDLLTCLLEQVDLPRDELAALILNTLLIGQQYTVSLLEYAMAEMVRHPICMLMAREELNRVVGGTNKQVDEGDLSHLPYLQCIIKETLRLHPPSPLGLPRYNEAPLFVSGYRIPGKCTTFVNNFAIGRDMAKWATPDSFKPERFEYSSMDVMGKHLDLIPFSSGSRMCPATSLVVLEATIALGNLIHAFEWSSASHMSWKFWDSSPESSISMDEAVLGLLHTCSRTSKLEVVATPLN